MVSEWDEFADGWDSDETAALYSKEAFDSLSNIVNVANSNLLDFGCGTGLLTEKLSPAANHIVAMDTSSKMLAVLTGKNLPNVTTITEPLSAKLIAENQSLNRGFDVIVASSVCGFLSDYEATLCLLKSVLNPSGTFVQWDWLSQDEKSDFGLSEESVISAYEKSGLTLVTLTQPFSLSGRSGVMPVLMGVARNT